MMGRRDPFSGGELNPTNFRQSGLPKVGKIVLETVGKPDAPTNLSPKPLGCPDRIGLPKEPKTDVWATAACCKPLRNPTETEPDGLRECFGQRLLA